MGLRLHFGCCASESGPSDGVNMVRKVYRVLDRPFSLFGLQGRYVFLFLAALGAGAVLSFISAAIVGTMAASILFIAIAVLVYFAATMLQTFWSERDILKFVSSRRVRNFIEVKPNTFTGQWK